MSLSSSTTKTPAPAQPEPSSNAFSQPTYTSASIRAYFARPTVAAFVAGGVAGAVSRTVVSPFERMKIIMQVQGPGSANYQGVWGTLSKMWKEEGWRGYMRGNGINCVRIVPYSAVQYSSYTIYKDVRVIFLPSPSPALPSFYFFIFAK